MAEQKKKLKDVLQAIYNAVKALVVQPDYAQNDSQQPDYIKNRTHYVESVSTSVWNQTGCNVGSGTTSPGGYPATFNITTGNKYNVTISQGSTSKTYEGLTAEYDSVFNGLALRKNWSDSMGMSDTSTDALLLVVQPSNVVLRSADIYGENCTVQVSEVTETIHKLDPKYLPDNVNQLDSITTSKSGKVTTVTFEETNGTETQFQVTDGNDGTNGKSAYQVAVDNGYSGTEAQWLASLKGADGVSLGEVELTQEVTTATDSVPANKAVYEKVQRLTGTDIEDILATGEAKEPALPFGYTELEWIYNENGSSGIDTGLIPNDANWRFVGSWARMKTSGGNWASIFRAYVAEGYNTYRIIRNNNSDSQVLVYNHCATSAGKAITLSNTAVDVWHTFDLSYGSITLDGTTTTLNTTQGTANTATMKLIDSSYYVKFKTFKAYHNGVLVGNFVPAKRDSDGEIGMYDTVTNTFFEHINSNPFVAGPEIAGGKDKILNGEGLSNAIATNFENPNKLPTVQAVKDGIEVWRDDIEYIYKASDLIFDGSNYVDTGWNPYNPGGGFYMAITITDLNLAGMSNNGVIISCVKYASPYPGFSIRKSNNTTIGFFFGGANRLTANVNTGNGSKNSIIFSKAGNVYTIRVNDNEALTYTYAMPGGNINLYIGCQPNSTLTTFSEYGKFFLESLLVRRSGYQSVKLFSNHNKNIQLYPQTTIANVIGSDALFLPVQSFCGTLVDYKLSDYPTLNPLKGDGFTLIYDKPIGSVNEPNLLCLYNTKNAAGTSIGTDFFYISINGWQYQLHLKKNGGTEWRKNYSPRVNENSCLIAASFNLKTGEVNFYVNGVKTLTDTFSVDNVPDFDSVEFLSVYATNSGRVRTIFNGCITDKQAIDMLNLYPNNIIKKAYENTVGFGKRLIYRDTTWSITNGSIVGTSDGNFQITMTGGNNNCYVQYSSAFLAPELLHYCKITAHLSITEVSDTFTFSGFGIYGGHKATIYDENGDVISTGVAKALNVGEYDLECYATLISSDATYLINWVCTAACKFTLSEVYVEILGAVIDLSPYTYRVDYWELYNGIQLPISSSAQFNTGILRAPIVIDKSAPEYPGQLRFYNNNVYIGYIQGTTCVWKQISN